MSNESTRKAAKATTLEALPTSTSVILKKGDKREIIKALDMVNPHSLLMDTTIPSMSKLTRQYGDEMIEQAVAMMIQDASVFVGKKMDKEQVIDTAVEILNTYPYRSLKLEEIYLICKEIKSAENYGNLTPSKMMNAVKRFWKDREARAINNSITQSDSMKGEMNFGDRVKKTVRLEKFSTKAIDRTRADVNKKFKK
jgi:hypothetical protein